MSRASPTLLRTPNPHPDTAICQFEPGIITVMGAANISCPVDAVLLNVVDGESGAYGVFEITIHCQKTGDRLVQFRLNLTLKDALALHKRLPELDFHDGRTPK